MVLNRTSRCVTSTHFSIVLSNQWFNLFYASDIHDLWQSLITETLVCLSLSVLSHRQQMELLGSGPYPTAAV